MVDSDVQAQVAALAAHLDATAELPMRPDVTHWVAEADAVASDVADAELPTDVVADRLGHVRALLSQVDETGDDEADGHVTAAKTLTDELLKTLG